LSNASLLFRIFLVHCLFAGLHGLLASGVLAHTISFSVTAPDLDVRTCKLIVDGQAQPANPDQLFTVLGLQNLDPWGWHPSEGKSDQPRQCQYLLAFKEAQPVGTLLVAGEVSQIAFLKSDAAYPGNV
jgi:hypothetical protein